jgi:putative membrane protein
VDRADLERRLDALVAENRVTIAVVFPAVGAVTLIASAEGWLPRPLAFNPALVLFGTLVMRLPLLVGLLPTVGRRAAAALGLLVAYTYAVEFVGVTTGLPYGEFVYGIDLGPMLFGAVPAGLPVFFLPLVLNAYLLVLLLGNRSRRGAGGALARTLASLGVVLVVDLVLDPGAVALGFWSYPAGGPYYGVPWSNYAGWVLSGAVAVLGLEVGLDRERLLRRLRTCPFMLDDLVSFVLLWGGVNAWFGHWVPVALAAGLAGALAAVDRFDFPVRTPALR